VGKPSLNAAQPYAKAEGGAFLLVPAYPGCPGTKAVKRLLLLVVVLLGCIKCMRCRLFLLMFAVSVCESVCHAAPAVCAGVIQYSLYQTTLASCYYLVSIYKAICMYVSLDTGQPGGVIHCVAGG